VPAKKTKGRYAARGVSTTKSEVHTAVERFDRGLFPGAFCKITPDLLTGDPAMCNVIHADGSGTKSILAYLAWRETGDPSVFRGIAQDSIVMNLDDLLCIGATGRILLSSTVNRNARNIPGEVLGELIAGHEEFVETLRDHGIDISLGGGETADVGDLTGTVVVDSCAVAVMERAKVIDGRGIKPGLAIVGLASAGLARYETTPNSGIGSNGLTSARHDLLSPHYRETYPETFDENTDPSLVYCGPYRLGDPLPGSPMTVGEAILSPTRTYAPVIHRLLSALPDKVRGIIHCSGGAQTKCLRFGRGVHFVKDALFDAPPIFAAIRKASGTSFKEMYQVFNMGHRMEIYCPKRAAKEVIAVAGELGGDARIVGRT
jgi:phosphoribosylformylglycinamidine cyclo-ligase